MQHVLAHFGEDGANTCGKCDLCRGVPDAAPDLETRVLTLLTETGPLTARALAERLGGDERPLLDKLATLVREGRARLNTANEYEYIG